jgi:hypothetical protein
LVFEFTLPCGAFATSLLREFTKCSMAVVADELEEEGPENLDLAVSAKAAREKAKLVNFVINGVRLPNFHQSMFINL